MTEIHRGGCACGAVRYQVRGQPSVVTVCHCTFCQRHIGVQSKLPWVVIPDGVAQFERGFVAAP